MELTAGTVSQAVKEVLASNRIYFDALTYGIANLTAMAEKIRPNIEMKVGSQVSMNTIVVALKRLNDHLSKQEVTSHTAHDIPRVMKMSLTDSIIDVEIGEHEYENLFERLSDDKDIAFSLFQTSKNCRLFTENLDWYDSPEQKISQPVIKEKKFTKITLDFSSEKDERTLNILLAEILSALSNTRINIHSAFFTPTEITLIADDSRAIRLYEILQEYLLKD